MESGQGCTSCGSTSFEEIDGLYYCTICSTQRTGFTLEVRQYDEGGPDVTLLQQVKEKKKRKKQQDYGEPWSYVEAYNLILNHQCTELEKNLNLGPEFRMILFTLWTDYLSECEIAFTGDEEHRPKINVTSQYRDVQLLGQGLDQVTKPLRASSTMKQDNVKAGNLTMKRVSRGIQIGEESGRPTKESLISDVESDGSNSDSDSDSETSDETQTNRFRFEYESREDRYEDDYGQVDEGSKKLEVAHVENFDLDDVPVVEWTAEMQENFLFNYDYKMMAIETFKHFNDQSSDIAVASSKPSKPFSALATVATTLSESEGKRIDFNGLRRHRQAHIADYTNSNDLLRLAQDYIERYNEGEDFEHLMEELEQIDGNKRKKKKIEAIENREPNEMDENGSTITDGVERTDEPPKGEYSKRSQLLMKLVEKANLDPVNSKRFWGHLMCQSFNYQEKITVTRLIQLIYLTFRIMGYNVYVGDLLHWIMTGHLTFFNVTTIFPDKWYILFNNDIISLCSLRCIQPRQIECYAQSLRQFLRIPTFPLPNWTEILMRQLFDLNLPLQLVDIIQSKISCESISKLNPLQFRSDPDGSYIPDFGIASICSIIIILDRLFCLDGETEVTISNHVRDNWPESFIWQDWVNDNLTIWKLMDQHYFPYQPKLSEDPLDVEVIRYYRETFTNKWFGCSASKYNRSCFNLTTTYRSNYAKSLEDALQVEPCTIEPPPFTVYHFHEARKFIAQRIMQVRGASSLELFPSSSSSSAPSSQTINIFDVNYTNKSIEFLFDQSFTQFNNGSLARARSESLNLIVKMASFITHRPPEFLIKTVKTFNSKVKF